MLLDSTGIKFLGEGEWKCKKHGTERRRQWRKLHSGIDAQTLQARAICVTSNNVSDAVVVLHLLAQLPADESLLSVTGDGAHDTQPVYAAVMERNAMPIIPARKNARMRKGVAFAHRNAAIAACRRFGRKLWKSWSITSTAWWRPRCTALNAWASGSCLEPSSARSTNCTSEPPFSIGSLN
ncbi:hypothetical protein CTR2_R38680 [Comamonas thiooxydans]|nr:hypothetical protein CTR2_R38680 [Comamonas thiooxydans]